ncbi:MAG TPA: amidohydrolase family protein [Chlamydiales bacterium]|nr:amidohydrolase family protein [Chlamydiales bacterium]
MKKIALEEHFITPDFISYSKEDFANFSKEKVDGLMDLLLDIDGKRIEEMDKAGIDIAVLSLTDPGVQREANTQKAIQLARTANDFLAEKIQKNPKRFRGFAHLAMQDPSAAASELERAVKDLRFVGALINGQTNGHYLDEKQFYPFWKKVEELQVPIYLHPGNPPEVPQNFNGYKALNGAFWGWTIETATHALRLIVGGVFDRFPKVKVILGHMGETLPYLLWRLDSRWKIMQQTNTLKKLPSQYLRDNFFITVSGMFANEPLLCAIQALGEDKVMFSVDYPYESSEVASQFIEKAPISEAVREKICFKNAERILSL